MSDTAKKIHQCERSSKENKLQPIHDGDRKNYDNHKNKGAHFAIGFEDTVIIDKICHCQVKKHPVQQLDVAVLLVKQNGRIATDEIHVYYCSQCNIYYITKSNFKNLREWGVVLCRAVKKENTTKTNNPYAYDYMLNTESILAQYGYSVKSAKPLTDEQRQTILMYLMESRVFSKPKIKNHLTWLIDERKYQKKMHDAVLTWEKDLNFVKSYKIEDKPLIGIKYRKLVK